MENSRLHSQEPSFRPEPLNQEPRWAIVTYRISLVSEPGGVINSNAHTHTQPSCSLAALPLRVTWGGATPGLKPGTIARQGNPWALPDLGTVQRLASLDEERPAEASGA